MLEALAANVLAPDRAPQSDNATTTIYRSIAAGSPPKKYHSALVADASRATMRNRENGVTVAVSNSEDRDNRATAMAYAQACGVSMFIALGLAAISYVPGLSAASYGGMLALLVAAFSGIAATER